MKVEYSYNVGKDRKQKITQKDRVDNTTLKRQELILKKQAIRELRKDIKKE